MRRPTTTPEQDRRLCLRWARQLRREVPSASRPARTLHRQIATLTASPFQTSPNR